TSDKASSCWRRAAPYPPLSDRGCSPAPLTRRTTASECCGAAAFTRRPSPTSGRHGGSRTRPSGVSSSDGGTRGRLSESRRRRERSSSNEGLEGERMTIRRFVVALVGMSVFLGGGPPAPSAQEMTERFIPVGQSPGLSGKYTVIGKLQSVNAREQICSVASAAGTVNVRITERTKIWLDRSLLRQPNVKGTIADL